ncbi:PREDICTED: uncharacterized protein LOC107340856 [Acropora digitifera]|uniref:uncharacterized protein LOC107340856 n=1 Tax=Acropora digitifera TaxID=70779 RepID=UPI00077A6716|nr:PREDICTED: uncharacterized protein LOC107340856 [Acropora digitifera]
MLTAPSNISTPSIEDSDGITLEQQRYAISLCPRKVLVSTLKPPRKEFKLRDIDDLFVKSLIAEFKENEVLFGLKPLLAIVKGVSKHEEFREELLDSYELEVIGENHRRAAMQHFLQENPDDLKFKYTEVILLTEMPKRVVLQIAFNHNRMDRFHHDMTTQEKVKLSHSILRDEFGGKKSTEWRNYCSTVINSKESLDFIFLLSGLEEEAFQILEDVFHAFDLFKIKDQTSSVSQARKLLSGAIQQPNLVASKFKCIRGLETRHLSGLLRKIADGKLSFAELKQHASEIKDLQVLKTGFVKKTGCKSWEEAVERFPDFTSDDLLKQFSGSIKKGKAGTDYQALIERALKTELAEDDSGHSTQLTWKDGLWYGALISRDHTICAELLKDVPFTGADLSLIQAQENWSEDKVKAVVRQICGLNTRTGMSNYTIVVRTNASLQSLEECTPGGKGHVMFVAWSGISAKAGTGLTDVVEKTCIIFVGTPLRSATNWFVAKKEEDIMIEAPYTGLCATKRELGNSQIQVSSCLKPSVEFKVNLPEHL